MRVVRSRTLFLTGCAVNERTVAHGPSDLDAGPNEFLRVTLKALVLDATAAQAVQSMPHVQLRSNLASTMFEPMQAGRFNPSTLLALAFRGASFAHVDGGGDSFASALSTRHVDRVELRLCDNVGTVLTTGGTYDVVLRVDVVTP